MTLFIFEELFF